MMSVDVQSEEADREEHLVDDPMEKDEEIPHDTRSLTSTDIKADPILSSLAKQQGINRPLTAGAPPKAAFKARPAPSSTHADGLGPKMTKSAALRQGLDWEAIKPTRSETTQNVGFESTPGHKRRMSLNIASLAARGTAPRQNRSSQLRAGESGPETTKKDMGAAAAENKAREKAERDARRKSVALPASLSTPSIVPKANRSSLLRAGSMNAPPVSFRPRGTLVASSAGNLRTTQEEPIPKKVEEKPIARRASMIGTLKSLATPSIAPRMNKAALLRAPGSTTSTTASMATSPSMPSLPGPSKPRPSVSAGTSATSSSVKPPIKTPASLAPHPGPKPTKASLLRAGLGAKIMSSKA